MHVARRRGGERGLDDADARIDEQALGGVDLSGVEMALERLALLARENGGAFDRRAARQQHLVAGGDARLANESHERDFAQHLSDDDRTVEAGRDLGVSAADTRADQGARLAHIAHDGRRQARRGGGLGQQEDREEPARKRAQHRHVVGVDVHGVGPDPIRRERHPVGRDDERAAAEFDNSRVLSDPRPDEHARVAGAEASQQRLEMRGG